LTAGFGFSSTSPLAELGSVSSDSASEEEDEASLSAFYDAGDSVGFQQCEFDGLEHNPHRCLLLRRFVDNPFWQGL
jgi:hypothetical protein